MDVLVPFGISINSTIKKQLIRVFTIAVDRIRNELVYIATFDARIFPESFSITGAVNYYRQNFLLKYTAAISTSAIELLICNVNVSLSRRFTWFKQLSQRKFHCSRKLFDILNIKSIFKWHMCCCFFWKMWIIQMCMNMACRCISKNISTFFVDYDKLWFQSYSLPTSLQIDFQVLAH